MNKAEYAQRAKLLNEVFRPATPINSRDLFAGRKDKLTKLINVEAQYGQHALVYGERGVGKTSIALITQVILEQEAITPDYTCNSKDTFKSIWRSIFNKITFETRLPSLGFSDEVQTQIQSASALISNDPTPHEVTQALMMVGSNTRIVVTIDEFDRPEDPQTRTLIADTIKILADRAAPITLILVGVADTVDELIAEHGSIQRSLVQVHMPRMTDKEIQHVVNQGMRKAGIEVEAKFVDEVATLSQGLPHYAHLMGQLGGFRALQENRLTVNHSDFKEALGDAIEQSSQKVRENYHSATFSNRQTLYKEVLLACALTNKDELGTFSASDVREKLREITSRDYDIPAFATHLSNFSSEGVRGRILQRLGTKRRFRYRFKDPLLPPYVVMNGMTGGLV